MTRQGYEHVRGERLQPLCRKLGIKFAPAFVGFNKIGSRYYPVLYGVVVTTRSAPKLQAAINERDQAALARKERMAKRAALAREKLARERANNRPAVLLPTQENAEARQRKQEDAYLAKCKTLGILPESRTDFDLRSGIIDYDQAELIGFRNALRHQHSDYETLYNEEDFQDAVEFEMDCGASRFMAREAAAARQRDFARSEMEEDPIPATWPKYLAKYGLTSPTAKALTGILQDPLKCHPRWFKEAEIAMRRYKVPLETATYDDIRGAMERWRAERDRSTSPRSGGRLFTR